MAETRNRDFDGFEKPDQNWFQLPKSWATVTRVITSIAELKVVEYVLLHTWSQHEHGASRRISINEFRFGIRLDNEKRVDEGTGLSKQSIITGLKKSVQRGLLVETIDARDRARVHKSYRLRMRDDQSDEHHVEHSSEILDADVQVLDPVKTLDTGGLNYGHRSENGIGIGSQEHGSPVTVSDLQNNPSRHHSNETARSQTSSSPAGDNSPLRKLPDNSILPGQRDHLVGVMTQKFRDVENKAYYILVSRKMHEEDIWTNMAEVEQDPNVRYPERVFATRIKKLATERLERRAMKTKHEAYEKQRREHAIGSTEGRRFAGSEEATAIS